MFNVNKLNYYKVYNLIKNFVKLPDHLKKGAIFIDKITNKGLSWDNYDDPRLSTYRDFADNYFIELGKFIDTNLKNETLFTKIQKFDTTRGQQQRTNRSRNKRTKGTTTTKKRIKKSVSTSSVKRTPKTPPVKKTPTEVSKLDTAIYIIKRYYNMHNDPKTYQQILNFTNDLQLAIIEKRITKSTPYSKEVMEIQDNLLHLLDNVSVNGKTKITFPVETLNRFRQIIEGQKQLQSVRFIKSYMNLQGTIVSNKTAQNLYDRILEAKIPTNDPYRSEIDKILNNLKVFIKKNHYKGLLTIPKRDLNGLMGISGVKPKTNRSISRKTKGGLNGLGDLGDLSVDELNLLYGSDIETPQQPKIYKASDIANMNFDVLNFTGKWQNFFGKPSRGFCTMVSGMPKFGKSTFCIEFADYLAKDFGKVLYVVKEEGVGQTLKQKLNRLERIHPNFECVEQTVNDFSKWDFVFLDSVTKLGYKPEDIDALRRKYPKTTFVLIFQVTKQGAFRGSNSFQHDVDCVVEIFEIGCARQMGRFSPYSELNFINPEFDDE